MATPACPWALGTALAALQQRRGAARSGGDCGRLLWRGVLQLAAQYRLVEDGCTRVRREGELSRVEAGKPQQQHWKRECAQTGCAARKCNARCCCGV